MKTIAAATLVISLFLSGCMSPITKTARRLQVERVAEQIETYRNKHGVLPLSLADVEADTGRKMDQASASSQGGFIYTPKESHKFTLAYSHVHYRVFRDEDGHFTYFYNPWR